MEASQTEISVIIPATHGAESLCVCLDALFHQDYPADSYDVVVISAIGRNDIKDIVDKKCQETKTRIILFESKNIIRAAMRNIGIRFASAPLVAFLDDDCIPGANWLKEITQFHNLHPDADIFGNNLTPHFYDFPEYSVALRDIVIDRKKSSSSCFFPILDPYSIGGNLATGNLAAKKNILSDLGGFDETLRGLADVELCIRALASGYKIYVYNAMDVSWSLSAAIMPMMRKYFHWGFAGYLIFRKHIQKKAVFLFEANNRNLHFQAYSPYPFIIIITPGTLLLFLFLVPWFYPYLKLFVIVYAALYYFYFYRYFKSLRLSFFYIFSSLLNCIAHSSGLLCGFVKSLTVT